MPSSEAIQRPRPVPIEWYLLTTKYLLTTAVLALHGAHARAAHHGPLQRAVAAGERTRDRAAARRAGCGHAPGEPIERERAERAAARVRIADRTESAREWAGLGWVGFVWREEEEFGLEKLALVCRSTYPPPARQTKPTTTHLSYRADDFVYQKKNSKI